MHRSKPRQIDTLLSNLKERQEAREQILEARKEGKAINRADVRDLFAGKFTIGRFFENFVGRVFLFLGGLMERTTTHEYLCFRLKVSIYI